VKYRLEATRVAADADAEMVAPHSLGLTRKTTTVPTENCGFRMSLNRSHASSGVEG
jgi:hypothetical protein